MAGFAYGARIHYTRRKMRAAGVRRDELRLDPTRRDTYKSSSPVVWRRGHGYFGSRHQARGRGFTRDFMTPDSSVLTLKGGAHELTRPFRSDLVSAPRGTRLHATCFPGARARRPRDASGGRLMRAPASGWGVVCFLLKERPSARRSSVLMGSHKLADLTGRAVPRRD